MQSGRIVVGGRADRLAEMMGLLDTFAPGFPVVEPRPSR
jgi:alkyl sulfatase BDS1-like metallo-beta-lactamase superfamily hydrolase